MTLGQGHDTPLGHGQKLCSIIQILVTSEKFWPGQYILQQVHCDLVLVDMTLSQGQDTPFGHGQRLCEVSSRRSKVAVKLYVAT